MDNKNSAFKAATLQFRSAPSVEFQLPYAVESSAPLSEVHTAFKHIIDDHICRHGAVLLRGAQGVDLDAFKNIAAATTGQSLSYEYGSTPRSQVGEGVYTATEYPSHQTIPLHNEQSYTNNWADYLWFFCQQAASSGGETTLADSREVFKKIPKSIRKRFVDRGVMYVRNYGSGYDLDWQDVFNTSNRSDVELFCAKRHITCEWLDGDQLRTSQVCQAHAIHQSTGDSVWFNQAHLFHVSALDANVRGAMLDLFGSQGLPRNAFYGDGSDIEDEILEEIRAVYDELSVLFSWESGDIMVIDNLLAAHGRQAFEGPRKVYVTMT